MPDNSLTWAPDVARLDSLELWDQNPKWMSKARAKRLLESWRVMGQYETLAVGPDGAVYDGHQRVKTLIAAGYPGSYAVHVLRANRPLTDDERRRVILESSVGTVGSFDWDALAAWDTGLVEAAGLDAEFLATLNDDAANLAQMLAAATAEVELPEQTESIRPKKMARILVSVPVDSAADAREILNQLKNIDGIEILYSGN